MGKKMDNLTIPDIEYLLALLLEKRKYAPTTEANHAKAIAYKLEKRKENAFIN